ncbi:hypothetical protein V8C35DRAFT_29829 [Trichoderma chlorosporum]
MGTGFRRPRTRYQESETPEGPRTSRNDAITQPHTLASPSHGPFCRCQNGKMNKGKSWGAAVVHQGRQISFVATMPLTTTKYKYGADLPDNCFGILIAWCLIDLSLGTIRKVTEQPSNSRRIIGWCIREDIHCPKNRGSRAYE